MRITRSTRVIPATDIDCGFFGRRKEKTPQERLAEYQSRVDRASSRFDEIEKKAMEKYMPVDKRASRGCSRVQCSRIVKVSTSENDIITL